LEVEILSSRPERLQSASGPPCRGYTAPARKLRARRRSHPRRASARTEPGARRRVPCSDSGEIAGTLMPGRSDGTTGWAQRMRPRARGFGGHTRTLREQLGRVGAHRRKEEKEPCCRFPPPPRLCTYARSHTVRAVRLMRPSRTHPLRMTCDVGICLNPCVSRLSPVGTHLLLETIWQMWASGELHSLAGICCASGR
jgi:hypothetical protein